MKDKDMGSGSTCLWYWGQQSNLMPDLSLVTLHINKTNEKKADNGRSSVAHI